jgi:ribulose-5-phosphate 4-epimerase/fuculose-1-phosphate aldolase
VSEARSERRQQLSPTQLALHQKIALACRIIGAEDISRMSFGHVSARSELDDNVIAMRGRTAADGGLQFCTEADILEMDLQGRSTGDFAAKAPREKWAHLGIYAQQPNVRAVAHVHPRWVVALSIAGRTLGPVYGAYDPDGLRLGAGGIATFPSSILIDSPETGRDLAATLGTKSACILTGHGIVTVGESIEAAVLEAIALTELAHVTWLAAAVGTPAAIPAVEQTAILGDHAAAEGTSAAAERGVRPSAASWQHFVLRDRLRDPFEHFLNGGNSRV